MAIAVRQRQRMGTPRPPKKTPKWQTGLDDMSPWYAVGLGPLTQPWGSGRSRRRGDRRGQDRILAELCGSRPPSVWSPPGSIWSWNCSVVRCPAQAGAFLGRIRSWMDSHKDHIIIVVSLALGLWLIGEGLYQVVT